MSDEKDQAKQEVRARLKAVRAAIAPGERAIAARDIGETLSGMLADAGAVMAFLSFGSELPTDGIVERLAADGHALVLPHITDGKVIPVAYAPGDPLEHVAFGIREPARIEPVDATAIDAVLVPGLAFDLAGYRVGYGGGFYDRLLPTLREDAARIGICFEEQIVEAVPVDEFDLPVHRIVTQTRVIDIP